MRAVAGSSTQGLAELAFADFTAEGFSMTAIAGSAFDAFLRGDTCSV